MSLHGNAVRNSSFPAVVFVLGIFIQVVVQVVIHQATSTGLALDDGYIHLTFARNLMRGLGLAYNPGEPVAGTTSPFWTLLLAASFNESWLTWAAIFWGSFFYAATGALVCWIAFRLGLNGPAALLAGAMTLLTGRLVWAGASGMEICAFAFCSLCGAYSHILDRRDGAPGIRTAFIMGIASGFRPEAYLLYALSLADHALSFDAAGRAFHLTLKPHLNRRTIAALAVFAAIISPYVIFCLLTNGHPFPNTYYAKMNENFQTTRAIYVMKIVNAHLDGHYGLFYALAPIGALAMMIRTYAGEWGGRLAAHARILWLWPLAVVLHGVLFNASLLPHFERYAMPILPFSILLAAVAFDDLVRTVRKKFGRRSGVLLASIIAAISIGAAASGLPQWIAYSTRSVRNINDMQVSVGRWLHEHTPPDSVVATHDVGAIAYFGQRRVIDVLGLVTTDVMRIVEDLTDRGEGALDAYDILLYVANQRPGYIAAFPGWMGSTVAQPEAFTQVHEVKVRDNLVLGHDTMAVWKANWDNFDPEKALPNYGNTYGYQGYSVPTTQVGN